MLPRKKYLRALCLSLASTVAASTLISAPANALDLAALQAGSVKGASSVKAVSGYTPPVTVNELSVTPRYGMSALSTGKRTTTLCERWFTPKRA